MMLAAGHFKIRNALPKPIWTYPLAYISFHTYSIEVYLHIQNTIEKKKIFASSRGNYLDIIAYFECFRVFWSTSIWGKRLRLEK